MSRAEDCLLPVCNDLPVFWLLLDVCQVHNAVPFEAMHKLMRHHAIGAKIVSALDATRNRVLFLVALATGAGPHVVLEVRLEEEV